MEKVYALFFVLFWYIFSGTKRERRDASGFACCVLVTVNLCFLCDFTVQ
jgi:hypothetical protein